MDFVRKLSVFLLVLADGLLLVGDENGLLAELLLCLAGPQPPLTDLALPTTGLLLHAGHQLSLRELELLSQVFQLCAMPILHLELPALLPSQFFLLPSDQKLLVVDDILTARHPLPQSLGLKRFLAGHAAMEVDVGAIEVHAHLHSRSLQLGLFGYRLAGLASAL